MRAYSPLKSYQLIQKKILRGSLLRSKLREGAVGGVAKNIHISGGICIGILSILWLCLPLFQNRENQPGRIFIQDRNGVIMTDIGNTHGYYIPLKKYTLEEIPFIHDLITIEDQRFYSHFGIDMPAKLRALWENMTTKEFSGGSTITEQYIKNTYFSKNKRTILQKIREAIFAFFFSLTHSKNTILEKYLNTIYLGNNIYGLQTASKVYFNKRDIHELSEMERVLLLTLIHSPSVNLEHPLSREYFKKIQGRLGYQVEENILPLPTHENIDLFPFITKKSQEICEGKIFEFTFFHALECKKGEFQSTIDAQVGIYVRTVFREHLYELSKKNVTNAAMFAINPHNNEVLIYEGSRDFYAKNIDGQVDVILSPRQPGSTMKPFLYLMALENDIQPDNLLIDLNEEYPSFQPQMSYTSENYSLKEYGLVRLKKALGNSLNNSSVKLARFLGLNNVYNYYLSYGFQLEKSPEFYGYALVLGNPSITLYDLVKSYVKIVPKPDTNKHIDTDKFLLYDMLRDPDNRDISFGVDSILNTSILQAVKTGTSSNFRDNTIISYSPDLVIGLWFGNNDNSSMIGVSGITGAGKTWHDTIEFMIQKGYITDKKITLPPGIEEVSYCLDEKCFQKEKSYQKIGTTYFSRISENIFDHRDMVEILTADETQKLQDMGLQIR